MKTEMITMKFLADNYKIKRATMSRHASGEAHLLILEKNNKEYFCWSHNGKVFSFPEKI